MRECRSEKENRGSGETGGSIGRKRGVGEITEREGLGVREGERGKGEEEEER